MTPSIYLAILNLGEIRIELVNLLMKWKENPHYRIYLDLACDKPIAHNRGKIVQRFLESGCDYLMMLDGDIIPPEDTIYLADYDKDVIGGTCLAYKQNSVVPLVLEKNSGGQKKYRSITGENMYGIAEVDAVGTGCILITRRVLEDVKAPFQNRYDEDGIRTAGLDLEFCRKAKQKGYKVWAHLDYLCSHWTDVDLKQIYQSRSREGTLSVQKMGKN